MASHASHLYKGFFGCRAVIARVNKCTNLVGKLPLIYKHGLYSMITRVVRPVFSIAHDLTSDVAKHIAIGVVLARAEHLVVIEDLTAIGGRSGIAMFAAGLIAAVFLTWAAAGRK